MPLFGRAQSTEIDARIEAALLGGDNRYNRDLRKAALKEQLRILATIEPDEQIKLVALGEGLGTAGVVIHGSAVVVTDRRLLVVQGGKVRNDVPRDTIREVGTGVSSRYRQQLIVAGRPETVMFEFDDVARRWALMKALGYEPA